MNELGKHLKEQREIAGLTQGELAQRIGVTKAAICNYEKGIRVPPFYTVLKITKALHVSDDYFFNDPECRPSLDITGLGWQDISQLSALAEHLRDRKIRQLRSEKEIRAAKEANAALQQELYDVRREREQLQIKVDAMAEDIQALRQCLEAAGLPLPPSSSERLEDETKDTEEDFDLEILEPDEPTAESSKQETSEVETPEAERSEPATPEPESVETNTIDPSDFNLDFLKSFGLEEEDSKIETSEVESSETATPKPESAETDAIDPSDFTTDFLKSTELEAKNPEAENPAPTLSAEPAKPVRTPGRKKKTAI